MMQGQTCLKEPPADAGELLTLSDQVDQARERLYRELLKVGERFVEKRMALAQGGFSGLNLLVRKRGRSVSAVWAMFHFKNGKRTGITHLPKVKGSAIYDVFTIGRNAPAWLYEAAVEVEMEVRPIREALLRLTEMDKALSVINARVGNRYFVALPASNQDGVATADPLDPLDPASTF